MDDNCVFIFCSMSSETAVTFTGGHFNQAVFAVIPYVLALTAQNHVATGAPEPVPQVPQPRDQCGKQNL